VAVTGTATLDGTLRVALLDGYAPQEGDAFQVLTFAARAGDFATVSLPDLGALTLYPLYDDGGLTLWTVPSA
jgi:hypothetical protein